MKHFRVIVFSLDFKVLNFVKNRLLWFGLQTHCFNSLNEFWRAFHNLQPDLIIIDDSFFSKHIFNFLKDIAQLSDSPIVFIANDFSNAYQIYFFQIDHVIFKPFSIRSFDLKLSSILTTKSDFLSPVKKKSDSCLYFDLNKKKLIFNKIPVSLTKTEYSIFSLLMSQTNEHSTKSSFLKSIWGYDDFWLPKSNFLEMHFSKLKKKLSPCFKKKKFLIKKKNRFLFRF
jgi:two-component system response regulator ArlR